jgi:CheY-like chemotaxis protein
VELEADMTSETKRFEILLAEDNAADAELVREALIQHQVNCSLRVVRDGAQAIAFINAIDVDPKAPALDLLLLDMRLPKSDGDEVLRRLRSTERYAQTPIIVMSGLSSSLIKGIATEHPAIVYFKKPSTLEEFMELGSIVRRVLEQGPAGDQPPCGGSI